MITPQLRSFLYDQVPRLPDTARFRLLDRRTKYMESTQYEGREFDCEGYRKGSPSVYGCGSRTTPWNERDVGVSLALRAEIVSELTDWTLGGTAFCSITLPDDEDAQDWAVTVTADAGLPSTIVVARNIGGNVGAMVVSYTVRNGRFAFEAHNPRDVWVLEWRDDFSHRPAVVAKVYRGENVFASSSEDLPMLCRVWDEEGEAVYRRDRDKTTSEWVWIELDAKPHGFGGCPVHWCPNGESNGAHDGLPDGGDVMDHQTDEVNELIAAAHNTTKRNSDDTLVLNPSPGTDTGGRVRKGGFNVIIANDAKYLGQDGESARICMELAEKAAMRGQRRAGVTLMDPKDLGQNTSGETLKRLFQRTINTAGTLRDHVARGLIRPLIEDVLRVSRKLGPKAFIVPPRVSTEQIAGDPVRVVTPRTPGKSSFVTCVWPAAFPPTAQDQQAAVQTASAATGGKPILSQETAVAFLASAGLPIPNVLEELARIAEDSDAAADREAKAMGAGQVPPGESGPVGEDEEPKEEPEAAE